MGIDFLDRGYTFGKVQFAVEFDKIIQNTMANSMIEDIQKQLHDEPEAAGTSNVD